MQLLQNEGYFKTSASSTVRVLKYQLRATAYKIIVSTIQKIKYYPRLQS